jgi:hypothetical protein
MITITPKQEAVREAIRLKSANCWGALSMANALGGSKTEAWDLAHTYPLKDLIAHARENNILTADLKAAVDETPVEQSLYFRRATGELTEDEFKRLFRECQNSSRP